MLLQELLYIIVYTGLINSFRTYQLRMRELLMPIDTAEESAAAAGWCFPAQSINVSPPRLPGVGPSAPSPKRVASRSVFRKAGPPSSPWLGL